MIDVRALPSVKNAFDPEVFCGELRHVFRSGCIRRDLVLGPGSVIKPSGSRRPDLISSQYLINAVSILDRRKLIPVLQGTERWK